MNDNFQENEVKLDRFLRYPLIIFQGSTVESQSHTSFTDTLSNYYDRLSQHIRAGRGRVQMDAFKRLMRGSDCSLIMHPNLPQ